MTRRFALRPRARRDLDDIWDYSQERWGADRAEAYMRDLWRAMQAIAADPRRGQPCDDVRTGYRKYRAASHMIFYRQAREAIDIVRILHARMDFEQHH
ncbi:MAG: type II toxin-antitoxin system RelE/ParE family toxin [Hyphomicrobium sp.]